MINKKLLSIFALAAMLLLPQSLWAASTVQTLGSASQYSWTFSNEDNVAKTSTITLNGIVMTFYGDKGNSENEDWDKNGAHGLVPATMPRTDPMISRTDPMISTP